MSTEQEKRMHRCCFTGHRPEKLSHSPDEVQQWLTKQIETAVADGFLTFITGMAMGIDIWAGEIVLRLRKSDPRLHLIAIVPWPGFSARWNEEWKRKYNDLIRQADLVKYVSKKYEPSIFMKRNTWMVDHSARVIGYYNGAEGGTKDTLKYAESQGIEVVIGEDKPPEEDTANDIEYCKSKTGLSSPREYPLNLIDAVMDCDTFRESKPVQAESIPNDFDRRLKVIASTMKDARAYDYLLARFRDGCTLQMIGDDAKLTRERVRQLLNKYIRGLRQPDRLRFLNCGIEKIPERSSATMVALLNEIQSSQKMEG